MYALGHLEGRRLSCPCEVPLVVERGAASVPVSLSVSLVFSRFGFV